MTLLLAFICAAAKALARFVAIFGLDKAAVLA